MDSYKNIASIVEEELEKKRYKLMLETLDEPPSWLSESERLSFILSKGHLKAIKQMTRVKRSSKCQIMWITIGKKDGTSEREFIDHIYNLINFKPFQQEPAYCFEATSYDNNTKTYGNIHCHFLCYKQIGYNIAKYKSLIKSKIPYHNLKVMAYPVNYYDDKIAYMNGDKEDEQDDKPEITKNFRLYYKLKDIYKPQIDI